MTDQPIDDALERAIKELSEPGRFSEAENRVAQLAPRLQQVLNDILQAGGWFDDAREGEILKAATTPDEAERISVMRVMLAEETRIGMLVGVAVGWELAESLRRIRDDGP